MTDSRQEKQYGCPSDLHAWQTPDFSAKHSNLPSLCVGSWNNDRRSNNIGCVVLFRAHRMLTRDNIGRRLIPILWESDRVCLWSIVGKTKTTANSVFSNSKCHSWPNVILTWLLKRTPAYHMIRQAEMEVCIAGASPLLVPICILTLKEAFGKPVNSKKKNAWFKISCCYGTRTFWLNWTRVDTIASPSVVWWRRSGHETRHSIALTSAHDYRVTNGSEMQSQAGHGCIWAITTSDLGHTGIRIAPIMLCTCTHTGSRVTMCIPWASTISAYNSHIKHVAGCQRRWWDAPLAIWLI